MPAFVTWKWVAALLAGAACSVAFAAHSDLSSQIDVATRKAVENEINVAVLNAKVEHLIEMTARVEGKVDRMLEGDAK